MSNKVATPRNLFKKDCACIFNQSSLLRFGFYLKLPVRLKSNNVVLVECAERAQSAARRRGWRNNFHRREYWSSQRAQSMLKNWDSGAIRKRNKMVETRRALPWTIFRLRSWTIYSENSMQKVFEKITIGYYKSPCVSASQNHIAANIYLLSSHTSLFFHDVFIIFYNN